MPRRKGHVVSRESVPAGSETRGLVVAKLTLAGCRGRRGTAVAGGGGPREDRVSRGEAGAERTEWRGVKKGSRACWAAERQWEGGSLWADCGSSG